MTLLFIDGFDHLEAADMGMKYDDVNLTGLSVGNSTPDTRHGAGNWLRITNSAGMVEKSVTAGASFVVGVAIYVSAHDADPFLRFFDAGVTQCELRMHTDGTLRVTRNGSTVTSGNSTYSVPIATWIYLEWKVTIANSIGASSCVVRVNGSNIITVATGQDLQNTSNASADSVVIGGSGGPTTFYYDDFYICNSSGSTNNDFLGDVKVLTIYPSGAGNSTDWTPSAGNNYECVDETPGNEDTDYVSETSAGDHDTYAMGNITLTGTVLGIQTNLMAKKDDAGTKELAPTIRSGSTDYDGTTVSVNSSYRVHSEIWEEDPDTSAAWTDSGVNAMEFGPKLIS